MQSYWEQLTFVLHKLPVEWQQTSCFPHDHIGVVGTVVMQGSRATLGPYTTTVPTTPVWHSGPGNILYLCWQELW